MVARSYLEIFGQVVGDSLSQGHAFLASLLLQAVGYLNLEEFAVVGEFGAQLEGLGLHETLVESLCTVAFVEACLQFLLAQFLQLVAPPFKNWGNSSLEEGLDFSLILVHVLFGDYSSLLKVN